MSEHRRESDGKRGRNLNILYMDNITLVYYWKETFSVNDITVNIRRSIYSEYGYLCFSGLMCSNIIYKWHYRDLTLLKGVSRLSDTTNSDCLGVNDSERQ